jgi:hypothetical protein
MRPTNGASCAIASSFAMFAAIIRVGGTGIGECKLSSIAGCGFAQGVGGCETNCAPALTAKGALLCPTSHYTFQVSARLLSLLS